MVFVVQQVDDDRRVCYFSRLDEFLCLVAASERMVGAGSTKSKEQEVSRSHGSDILLSRIDFMTDCDARRVPAVLCVGRCTPPVVRVERWGRTFDVRS